MKRKWFAILLMVTLMLSNSLSILARDLSESELGDEYIEENNTGKILITDDKSDNSIVKKKTNMVSTINEIEEKEEDTDTQNNISSVMATSDEKINKSLFAGGTGTIEDPFQISDAEQMNNVRQNLSANYILMNDIDLSGYSNWEPIGIDYETPFVGTFDGNNHTITGLTIIKETKYVGLFGYCSGLLKNIKIKSAMIDIQYGTDESPEIGVIAGVCQDILSCDVVSSHINVIGEYNSMIFVGGIVSRSNGRGTIQSCSSSAIFNLNSKGAIVCGGIATFGTNIIDCLNYGRIDIVADGTVDCGGIVYGGDNILRCVNYANISANSSSDSEQSFVGGIVGFVNIGNHEERALVSKCVNYGNLEWMGNPVFAASGFVSGIGQMNDGTFSNCFNLGNITAHVIDVYRITWRDDEPEIEECYALESSLINGLSPTEDIGADKSNGANLSEEEISERIEALGLDSDKKEDEEETTTKKTIQGAIEHSYGSQTGDTKVEELLSEYVDDWYSAYIDYTCAVEEVLIDSVEASAPTKKQAIKRRKEAMIEADSNSQNKEKYISGVFHDEKIKEAAYEGFSNFLYDTICSEIDISNINAEDINGTKLVNTILKSVKQASISKTYKINGIKVTIKTAGIGNVSFGSITCNSSLFHTYTICSTTSQCQKAIANYMKELMGLTDSAIYQVYSSVCKDVLGVSLDKLTQKYLSQNLTKKVSKYASKFEASGIGNLATNLNSCYNYYQYTKKMMGIIDSKDSPEKILEAMKTYGKFEDSSISDNVVKKAWNELKKATTNLNEAYLSYISGTDSKLGIWWDRVKPKWGEKDTKIKAIFSCPVNVFVLNSSGQQIGYAGEDDVWFDNNIIYVEEKGDAKIIYSSSEEPISFNVSATAYGVLGCSIEDYDEIGLPVGRTNYYDIELHPGKNITVSRIKNATDGKVDYTVTSDGQTINANEYIPSTQNAVVSIGCNVVKGGIVDGTGSYVRGDAAVLTATPSDNSRFVGWMQGEHLLDTARIYEFTAKENTTITALFVDISESESWDSNGSSGSNNELGDSQKPTDTNGTPNHNSQTDNNGTNKDNPVFTETSTNNTPTGTTSPQTGDENPLFMLIIIVLITGGIVAGSVLSSMKARKNA